MNIDELLDVMDETLEEAVNLPFTGGKRMVDVEKVRDIIDDIRLEHACRRSSQAKRHCDRTVADIVDNARRRKLKPLSSARRTAPAPWWPRRPS